ncbi:hypothetical protein BaRGS_00019010 [Batillaria attramentaria]|uniref:Uncharacterized protein n=1 Tax=Batillaria attramentaria TaxID=370345 RepID=A0ABD0KQR1_9CAEN
MDGREMSSHCWEVRPLGGAIVHPLVENDAGWEAGGTGGKVGDEGPQLVRWGGSWRSGRRDTTFCYTRLQPLSRLSVVLSVSMWELKLM